MLECISIMSRPKKAHMASCSTFRFTQTTTTTYVLTRLKKCWRSTKAKVERTMMVVHIVPRAHRPADKETAGSTWSSHSESTHPSLRDLFVSSFLSLPGWIGNIGGLVNPRLEKMTWCITEAELCCTPKVYCDVCALITCDSYTVYIYTLDNLQWKACGFCITFLLPNLPAVIHCYWIPCSSPALYTRPSFQALSRLDTSTWWSLLSSATTWKYNEDASKSENDSKYTQNGYTHSNEILNPAILCLIKPVIFLADSRMRILSSQQWHSPWRHLWLGCLCSVMKPLVHGQQTDGSSHKWLSGMSSSSDVAVHLFCSFEMSSCPLIGKFSRPSLKHCADGELHRLTKA